MDILESPAGIQWDRAIGGQGQRIVRLEQFATVEQLLDGAIERTPRCILEVVAYLAAFAGAVLADVLDDATRQRLGVVHPIEIVGAALGTAYTDGITLPFAESGDGDEGVRGQLLGAIGERFAYTQELGEFDRSHGVGAPTGAEVPDAQAPAERMPTVTQTSQRTGQDVKARIVEGVVIDVDTSHIELPL